MKLLPLAVLALALPLSGHVGKLPNWSIQQANPRVFPTVAGGAYVLQQYGLIVEADVVFPPSPPPTLVRFTDSRGAVVDVPVMGAHPGVPGLWLLFTGTVPTVAFAPGEGTVSVRGPFVVRSEHETVRFLP